MFMSEDINQRVLTSDRQLPTANTQNVFTSQRGTRYGDVMTAQVLSHRQSLCLEGSYFVAHNNTNDASTTLAGHAAPVLADADVTMTKPLIFMRMPDSAEKYAILDSIEIEVITAGASGTAANWAAQLDTGATRYSSGTVETLTTYNTNMRSSRTPDLVTMAGPVVVGAESASVRRIGFGEIKPTIELAGDKFVFRFGQDHMANNKVAAAASYFYINLPPVVLGPTDQFLLALYQPSQNAAGVYKVRCAWSER